MTFVLLLPKMQNTPSIIFYLDDNRYYNRKWPIPIPFLLSQKRVCRNDTPFKLLL